MTEVAQPRGLPLFIALAGSYNHRKKPSISNAGVRLAAPYVRNCVRCCAFPAPERRTKRVVLGAFYKKKPNALDGISKRVLRSAVGVFSALFDR